MDNENNNDRNNEQVKIDDIWSDLLITSGRRLTNITGVIFQQLSLSKSNTQGFNLGTM